VLGKNLKVMDATSIVLCRDNNLPIVVYDLFNRGDLEKIIDGVRIGTKVG
jgi:uridylate kinase